MAGIKKIHGAVFEDYTRGEKKVTKGGKTPKK